MRHDERQSQLPVAFFRGHALADCHPSIAG